MKVEYSRRAVSADSRQFGEVVALAVEKRIREIVAILADHPEAYAQVVQRPEMRVVPLVRYPYKIFYRVLEDRVRILHIRHTLAPAVAR
jgi:toxin ParE1/3/4